MKWYSGVILILGMLPFIPAGAQSYFTNGTAKATGNQCYELTRAINNQNGSVWYADQLDLTKSFDLEFSLNFGNRDVGADGIVFVMQTVGTSALGNNGGGIGFEGFSPSLGIEFDTYENGNYGDLAGDHIGIFKNGSVNHTSGNKISGPVLANASGSNIEDGKAHPVRIQWNPVTEVITVSFDCSVRLSTKIDLVDAIFSGKTLVYWGFTSATGGQSNTHVACLRDDIIISDTFEICRGNSIKLNARLSTDNEYQWSPATYLSNAAVRNPICKPDKDITYTVAFKDVCGNVFKDTVTVLVDDIAPFSLGKDTTLCNGARIYVGVMGSYDSVKWENGFTGAFRNLNAQGTYIARAWKGGCYYADTLRISTLITPTLDIVGEPTFCKGQFATITARVNPSNQTMSWEDGSTQNARQVNKSGIYVATARNMCGEGTASFEVKELSVEPFNLGPDTAICPGGFKKVNLSLTGQYAYLWNDGTTQSNNSLRTEGVHWLKVSSGPCFSVDSIRVSITPVPKLDFPDEIILCHKQTIELDAKNLSALVIWNGVEAGRVFMLNEYSGLLGVSATNVCGRDTHTIFINLVECYCDLFFPNAITPNQDDLNETFGPVANCQKLISYELKIFNRWGEMLYQTDRIEQRWDMTYKGSRVPDGVYYFLANYKGMVAGENKVFSAKGTINAFR